MPRAHTSMRLLLSSEPQHPRFLYNVQSNPARYLYHTLAHCEMKRISVEAWLSSGLVSIANARHTPSPERLAPDNQPSAASEASRNIGTLSVYPVRPRQRGTPGSAIIKGQAPSSRVVTAAFCRFPSFSFIQCVSSALSSFFALLPSRPLAHYLCALPLPLCVQQLTQYLFRLLSQ